MLDQAPLELDREGIKAREDGERGGGGRLLEGGDYFKHFGLRRRLFEFRGTAFIRGLFCFGVMVECDNLVIFELPRGLYYGEVLLLFVGMIGRVKR